MSAAKVLDASSNPASVTSSPLAPLPLNPSIHALNQRYSLRGGRARSAFVGALQPHRYGAFFPVNMRNPYQLLLYADPKMHFYPLADLRRLDRLPKMLLPKSLHLHWEDALIAGVPDAELNDAVDAAMRRLARLQQAGRKLVWTVHNYAAHDDHGPSHANAVLRLRRHLAESGDLIHVHGQHSANLVVEELGAERTRVAVVEHPSYLEWYPDLPRERVLPDARRFLSFGYIRGYKGLDRLLAGFAMQPASSPILELHIAGPGDAGDLPARAGQVPVRVSRRYIPDAEVLGLFREADFAVLAHSKALTSGSVILAAGFGVPPILPGHPGLVEGLPGLLRPLIYDPNDPNGLARAISSASRMGEAEYRELSAALVEHARRISPSRQSRRLREAMERLDII